MKKSLLLFAVILLVPQISFADWQADIAPDGKPWIQSSISYAAVDNPNLDPAWDWRQQYYTVYWNRYNGTPTSVLSPFYSNVTGGVAFTLDYEPQDGWVLLYRDFGTSQYFVSNPHFMLYNVYQGLLRVFFLVNSVENYTSGGVELFFDNGSPTTALFTHASNRAWATDNYKNNRFFAITDLVNYHWTYVDYITAYDPATANGDRNNSILTFKLLGVDVTNVNIDGKINLVQQLPKSSINTKEGNISPLSNLVTDGQKVLGYYNTFNNYKDELKKAAEKQSDSKLKSTLTGLADSWLAKNLPYIGAAIGIVDLFVGGGREKNSESPVPMVFEGSMSLSGTLETKELIFKSSIQTPGTGHILSPNAVPLWNYPLGVINLTKTPVLLSRQYWQPEGPNRSMQYSTYQIKEDLQFNVNTQYPNTQYSHLRIKYMEVALIFRFDPVYPYPYDLLPGINDWWNQGIYELESSANGKYILRTRYIPYNLFKSTSIRVPPGTDITIKLKAVLERIDSPDAQEVVFIADYEPVFEKDSGTVAFPWSANQLPLAPVEITGYVTFNDGSPITGVTLSGLSGNPTTDNKGYYCAIVPYGWTGSAKPLKEEYVFSPGKVRYSNVTSNMSQNYILTTALSATNKTPNSFTANWTAMNGATEYFLDVATDANFNSFVSGYNSLDVGTATSYAVTGLNPNTTYYYRVRWYNRAISPNSNTITVTTASETYTISVYVHHDGVGLSGVTINGLPGNPVTNQSGYYTATVSFGWSGLLSPSPAPPYHTFSPVAVGYSNVTFNMSMTFTAIPNKYTISGTVRKWGNPLNGVKINGLPGNPKTDANGYYVGTIDYDWVGTVTPVMTGLSFSPSSRTYSKVTSNQSNNDYTANQMNTISGHVRINGTDPLSDVAMFGLPSSTYTDANGFYTCGIPNGWSGTVIPVKPGSGYIFSPSSVPYNNVTSNLTQDYTTQGIFISGYVQINGDPTKPLSGVEVRVIESSGTTTYTTDANGFYKFARPSGWSGEVRPLKSMYLICPSSTSYSNVTSNQSTNYTATL